MRPWLRRAARLHYVIRLRYATPDKRRVNSRRFAHQAHQANDQGCLALYIHPLFVMVNSLDPGLTRIQEAIASFLISTKFENGGFCKGFVEFPGASAG